MWLLRGAPKNKEYAEWILKNRGHELTEEQKAYLMHVIEEGKRAEEFLKEVDKKRESNKG